MSYIKVLKVSALIATRGDGVSGGDRPRVKHSKYRRAQLTHKGHATAVFG